MHSIERDVRAFDVNKIIKVVKKNSSPYQPRAVNTYIMQALSCKQKKPFLMKRSRKDIFWEENKVACHVVESAGELLVKTGELKEASEAESTGRDMFWGESD